MALIDLTGYRLTFDDEFNTRSISQTGQGTTWADIRSQWRFDANSDIGFGHSSFVDPASGYDPFAVQGGALAITAVPDRTKYGYPGSWESGLITTQGNFSQIYGYFEMRADLADTKGGWDAFWLLPNAPAPNPNNLPGWEELDVIEHYGAYNQGSYRWIHTTDPGPNKNPNLDLQVFSNNPTQVTGYHTYGMNWQKDTISFYFDGQLMGSRPTPSDMHGPMYLLANLATQNDADAAGVPMTMKIDYIRAYSNDPNATAIAQQAVSAPDGKDPGLYGASTAPTVKYSSGNFIAETNKLSFGTVISDPLSAGGKIYALYDGLLERAPDAGGFATFTTALNGGTNLHDVTASILASPEAQQHLNASDNSAFVEQLYETVLGREGDVGGRSGWTIQLNNGVSRADLASDFVFSQEHLASLQAAFQDGIFVPDGHAADVARLYYGLLDRAPDASGLQGFTSAVKNGLSLHNIAQAMLDSPEYNALAGPVSDSAYVESLYNNALGRHSEAGGLHSFTNALARGTSRADVAVMIAESPEAQHHLVSQIEQGWHLA